MTVTSLSSHSPLAPGFPSLLVVCVPQRPPRGRHKQDNGIEHAYPKICSLHHGQLRNFLHYFVRAAVDEKPVVSRRRSEPSMSTQAETAGEPPRGDTVDLGPSSSHSDTAAAAAAAASPAAAVDKQLEDFLFMEGSDKDAGGSEPEGRSACFRTTLCHDLSLSLSLPRDVKSMYSRVVNIGLVEGRDNSPKTPAGPAPLAVHSPGQPFSGGGLLSHGFCGVA